MYSKVFSSMFNGTLATKGPWEVLVTFTMMLILADKYGTLDMTAEVISRTTTIPLDIILKGIAVLEQPDPLSRRGDNDGRRITRLRENTDWGWEITNYEYYRNLRTAEERQLYFREHKRKQRAAAKLTGAALEGNDDVRKVAVGVVETLPLKSGEDFAVIEELVAELEPLYPAVDIKTTLREMKGWLTGNPDRRKTKRGIRKFICGWLQREQEKHGS